MDYDLRYLGSKSSLMTDYGSPLASLAEVSVEAAVCPGGNVQDLSLPLICSSVSRPMGKDMNHFSTRMLNMAAEVSIYKAFM